MLVNGETYYAQYIGSTEASWGYKPDCTFTINKIVDDKFSGNFSAAITDNCTIITVPIEMVSFDFVKDGYINAKDYAQLIKMSKNDATNENYKYYDIDKNGVVDNSDWKFAPILFNF